MALKDRSQKSCFWARRLIYQIYHIMLQLYGLKGWIYHSYKCGYHSAGGDACRSVRNHRITASAGLAKESDHYCMYQCY